MLQNFRVDLHIHSTASDGTWGPDRLVKEIKKRKIKLFSITDHDALKNLEQMQHLAKKAGLYFLSGVEINTLLNGYFFHILGYGFDYNHPKLIELVEATRKKVSDKDEECLLLLINKGYDLKIEDYRSYCNDPSRGGWKCLNFLQDKGIVKSGREFIEMFFNNATPLKHPDFPTPKEAVNAIVEAGGIAILAHPGSKSYKLPAEKALEMIKKEGIHGVECFHPDNDLKVSRYCYQWCQKNDLLITGGSDCHGDYIQNRQLGMPKIYLKQLNLGRILELVIT